MNKKSPLKEAKLPLAYHETKRFWKDLLETGLYEDQIHWDWTAKALVDSGLKKNKNTFQAKVIAKSPGVWTGDGFLSAAAEVFKDSVQLSSGKISNGDRFQPKEVLLNLVGQPAALLGLERTLLNLLSYSCGIAFQTRIWVDEIHRIAQKKKITKVPRLTATRKTLPHYKEIELEAVVLGGGFVHRPHLAGGILIKENHIRLAGGVSKAIEAVYRSAPHGQKIEIEVTNLSELNQALDSVYVGGVMLDNFSPKEVEKALQQRKTHPRGKEIFIEISGGLTFEALKDYVCEGIDVLSSGKLTHSVTAVDLSLLW